MRSEGGWRDAVVTRARTVAQGVRLVEFAVAGPVTRYVPGSHVILKVESEGARTYRSYTCLPAEPGTVRVVVRARERIIGGSRYMWTLIEGARARLAVSGNRSTRFGRASSGLQAAVGIPFFSAATQAIRLNGVPVRLACGTREAGSHVAANIIGQNSMNRRFHVEPSHEEKNNTDHLRPSVALCGGCTGRKKLLIMNNSYGAGNPSPDRHPFQGRT